MSDTATIPLWDALGAAIDAGVDPPQSVSGSQILGDPRFYRMAVKGTPPPGYYILGLVDLVPGGQYNGETGENVSLTIHCWAPTPDDAEKLYRWLRRLVHLVPLAVQGFGTVTGQLSKSGPKPDATGAAYQVTAIYAVEPEDA